MVAMATHTGTQLLELNSIHCSLDHRLTGMDWGLGDLVGGCVCVCMCWIKSSSGLLVCLQKKRGYKITLESCECHMYLPHHIHTLLSSVQILGEEGERGRRERES